MPKVVYHDSDGVDKTVALGAEPVLIGRATECHIQTQDAMVSRRHARIAWDGNYWIEDLGSSNGVYVGNERVQRAPFRPGDVVTCGSLVMRLMPDTSARPNHTGTRPPAASLAPPPPAPPPPVASLAPPPAAPPRLATLAPPPPAPSAPPVEIQVGPNAVLRGASAAAVAGGSPKPGSASGSSVTGSAGGLAFELEQERRRRAEVEEALLAAAARTQAAEARVAELEEPAREAAGLRRKVDQLTADLRRLRGGRPVEEEHTNDDTERRARQAAESERDELRRTVADLERRLKSAAPASGKATNPAAADAAILLSDSLAELRASLRAAVDEARLLTQPGESVQVVGDALRSASDQLEAARANLRILANLLGV